DAVETLKSSLVPAPRRGELVIASQIDFHAMCPHHLLPYKGTAAVGYVADQWLVGFGKIAEATDALAHRLILQEQLVHRLCESVAAALSPLGVGVVLVAEHGCMQVRGPMRRQSRVRVEAWAGVLERAPIEDYTAAQWARVLGVNLRGAYLCAREAFRTGATRIVGIGSISGTLGTAHAAAYNARKWGLTGLVKSLAEEGRGRGIFCAAVLPGAVDTEMLKQTPFPPRMRPQEVAR